DEWRLSPFSVRLGNTTMNAELALASLSQRPVFQARVVVDNLDLDELEHMLPPSDPNAPVTPSIDLPILPHGISLFDADIDVQLKHIAMQPAPVNDVSFSGRIRDGHMWPSPFSATLAGAKFSGAVALDLRGQIPEGSLWVAAENVDIGAM